MKTLYRLSGAFAALVLLAGPALAQVRIQPKQIQIDPKFVVPGVLNDNKLMLLDNKGVQEDLKLTAEQAKAVKELAAKFKEATKDLKGREALQKSRELIQQNQQAIEKLLNGEQNKRLGQLEVQQKGVGAFFDQKVSKELNLTNEQRAQIQQ